MLILSPSYKRHENVETHKILPGVKYCVHEFEADDYRKNHDIIVIPDSIRGNIARVRNWLLNYSFETDDRVLIIDDDVKSLDKWCKIDGSWQKVSIKKDNLIDFIELGFDMAGEWGVKLWGVNCLGDRLSYREYTPFSNKSYCSGSFHGILKNEIRYDERIPLKEDYDYCIQHLNKYRKILRFNAFSMAKEDHKNEGGCAMYRTVNREIEQMKIFQKKWGSAIVKYDKSSKMDINPIVKVPIKGV